MANNDDPPSELTFSQLGLNSNVSEDVLNVSVGSEAAAAIDSSGVRDIPVIKAAFLRIQQNLEDEVDFKTQQLTRAKEDILQTQRALEDVGEQARESAALASQYREQHAEAEARLRVVTQNAADSRREWHAEQTRLNAKIIALERKIAQMVSVNEKLKQEMTSLVTHQETSQVQKKQAETLLMQRLKELNEKWQETMMGIRTVHDTELEQVKDDSKKEINKHKKEVVRLTTALEELCTKVKARGDAIKENHRKQKQKLIARAGRLKAKMGKSEKRYAEANEVLEASLNKTQQELAIVSTTVNGLRKQLEEKAAEHKDTQALVARLESDLKSNEVKHRKKESKLAQEISRLKQQLIIARAKQAPSESKTEVQRPMPEPLSEDDDQFDRVAKKYKNRLKEAKVMLKNSGIPNDSVQLVDEQYAALWRYERNRRLDQQHEIELARARINHWNKVLRTLSAKLKKK